MMSKGHYQGPKRKGRHTTVIPFAMEVVKFVEKLDDVSGISLGIINAKAKSAKPRIIVKQLSGALEVKACGNTSNQTLTLFTKNPEAIQSQLEQQFA